MTMTYAYITECSELLALVSMIVDLRNIEHPVVGTDKLADELEQVARKIIKQHLPIERIV